MKLSHTPPAISLVKGNSRFSFLDTGDIYSFLHDDMLINQFIGNRKDGSTNNIWLRIYKNDAVAAYPLLGINSTSTLSYGENSLLFQGNIDGISYSVTFWAACEDIWFWDISLEGNATVDVVYGQDIGVANMGGVLTNELYTAQYLGHSIFEDEHGYRICSRQNQSQGGSFPYLAQGMLNGRAVGYSTDAMQFFGLDFKKTNTPCALSGDLQNRNYQFECSYIALQSAKMLLNGIEKLTFFGIFSLNHADAVTTLEFDERIAAAYNALPVDEVRKPVAPVKINAQFGAPYTSPQWDATELDRYFPQRELEEINGSELFSFFTADHSHIAMQAKELSVERPHGSIITTKINETTVDSNLITSTNAVYGLFNGQTVAGNTSMHKFLSTPRGLLNLLKNSGQRLWVKLDDTYRLLSLPAAFEMGMNYSRWYYKLPNDTLIVTSFAVSTAMEICLDVRSEQDIAYDFILSNQLVMGDSEYGNPIDIEEKNGVMRFTSIETFNNSPYNNLHYDLSLNVDYTMSDDRIFFEDGKSQNSTLVTLSIEKKSGFQATIRGALEADELKASVLKASATRSFEYEKASYQAFYSRITSGFNLANAADSGELKKLNHTAWWYAHNALVHFAVPHGLEQPGGAAWGTRDVCQGPMEFFLATQNNTLAREVLCTIFAHQFKATGEWPQWFMFDKYTMNAGESHGDVVFWPLKCVADYINATGDSAVLFEKIPFFNEPDPVEIIAHIKAAVSHIEERFLEGTSLISYAGGDWDDTLQPASDELKQSLVSSWTQALAYQSIKGLADCFAAHDKPYAEYLAEMAGNIKDSFNKFLVLDGIICGFVHRNSDGSFKPMLHPQDNETGIHLRLLPMTRSIIAELSDPTQAIHSAKLIDDKLKCPDGVRLMDNPARYAGGVSHLFCRAEQAANVGREISLQYVHAHIRYIEAMCKLGYANDAWHALFCINPIGLSEVVPNALPRQSNLYFSSSEGAFDDRYEYARDFSKLKDGSIDVKGGWRLYSSGPGIYLNQLISNILGIRFTSDTLIIDPVLPEYMDGLTFSYTCFGKDMHFCYHVACENARVAKITIDDKILQSDSLCNPYRSGAFSVAKSELTSNEIHIWME